MKYILKCILFLVSLTVISNTASAQLQEVISGTLKVRVVDQADGSHFYNRFLQVDGIQLTLNFPDFVAEKLNKELGISGIRVEVTGNRAENNTFIVSSYKVLYDGRVGTLSALTGSRKMLIIMVNFAGKSQSCTSSQLDSVVYTGTKSTQKQFETSSKNQFSLVRDTDGNGSADIYGPITISESSGSCNNPDGWATQAKSVAQSAGINLSLYKHIFYSMPLYDVMGCEYSGLADLGCGTQCEGWILDCSTRNTWTHEFGHNLGMEHSATDTNNDTVLEQEYGDHSCPMGNPEEAMQFNAIHQDQMGWFDAFAGKKTTISSTGAYSMVALETNASDSSLPMTLTVQKSTGDFYYISYRSPIGLFNEIPSPYSGKVSIHRWTPTSTSNRKSRFIKALSTGQTFNDSAMGLTVCVGTTSSTHANVGVALNGSACSASNPTTPTPTPSATPTPTAPPTGGADPSTPDLPNDESGPDDDSITPLTGDADGDGVSDSQEAIDGTSASDPGSYFSRLTSPTYTLWNGFLSMINILELINPSTTTAITVQLSLYDINGTLKHAQSINLAASQQQDIIVNQLPGFTADSYGMIKLEYTSPISGRMSFYRADGSQYQFAYSVPLDRATKGKTILGFNTFQPSTRPAESNFQVYNWLTLVNLETSAKSFTIRTYNQVGTRMASRIINVPALGRVDIDGGHGLLGSSVVGIHQIRPDDPNGQYIAQIIRYGSNAPSGSIASGYYFAFPINAQAGNGRTQIIPISRQFGEANWLELINARNATIPVTVKFYNNQGLKTQASYSLAAFSQTHIGIGSSILADSERGYAEIIPDGNNSILAQSMNYYRNTSGSIEGMFGLPSREALGSTFTGSFNLYLNMDNWLTLTNTSTSALTVYLSTKSPGGDGFTSVSLGANSTSALNIGTNSSLLANADTYGSLRLVPDRVNSLSTNLIRRRPEGDGIDFTFPTEMRAE
jgi:hypothetical protein